jgi:hypothetical protein
MNDDDYKNYMVVAGFFEGTGGVPLLIINLFIKRNYVHGFRKTK